MQNNDMNGTSIIDTKESNYKEIPFSITCNTFDHFPKVAIIWEK